MLFRSAFLTNFRSLPCPMPIRSRMPSQPQKPPQHHPQNPFLAQPRPSLNPNPNTNTNPRRNFPERKPAEFTPIPMSYVDLLPSLLSNQMVVVSPEKVYQPPFPRWYNPTSHASIMVAFQGILFSKVWPLSTRYKA